MAKGHATQTQIRCYRFAFAPFFIFLVRVRQSRWALNQEIRVPNCGNAIPRKALADDRKGIALALPGLTAGSSSAKSSKCPRTEDR